MSIKAVRIHRHGGPEQVVVEQADAPRPGAGEVVVDLRAVALNHLDIWIRKGRPGVEIPMPHILGSDGAGVVSAIGKGVEGVAEGDEVSIYPGLHDATCPRCRQGQQSECENFGIVGVNRPGTFAEQVALPARNVYPKPARLGFEQTAALPVAYLTAWRMVHSRARVLGGETVLIHGIGGGVALAALQWVTRLGARAIVTSSSDEKLRRAGQLGAEHGINYSEVDDVASAVREWTDGRGVDVAIDAVGAATFPIDLAVLRRGGRAVLCGVTTGAEAPADLRAIYWNQLSVLGSTLGSDHEMRLMLAMADATRLEPVIDSIQPLDQARTAMEKMESEDQFGKIVLRVKA